MRIRRFWARGFRSLREVHIDDFAAFNVFYGPNGAGKSNVLAALELLLRAFHRRIDRSVTGDGDLTSWRNVEGLDGWLQNLGNRCHLAPFPTSKIGAELQWTEDEELLRPYAPDFYGLVVEVELEFASPGRVRISKLSTAEGRRVTLMPYESDIEIGLGEIGQDELNTTVELPQRVAEAAFTLIPADRIPRDEARMANAPDIAALLAAGQLKQALLQAHNHPDRRIRHRYKQFRQLMTGPPFSRPPFDIVEDPQTRALDLVEDAVDSPDSGADVSLDLAGLGIAQVYSIVAQAVLGGARAVAIEEPEAHLHAPTTGIQLRQLLVRLVDEGFIDQLFIATHSNLFDLNDEAYYDVAFDSERGTMVKKKQLDQIDARHLYEPGPAKHALMGFLDYLEDDAIVFRTPTGEPISVKEMLSMLQRDDPVAVAFLRDVHAAAVRAVRVKSKKPAS